MRNYPRARVSQRQVAAAREALQADPELSYREAGERFGLSYRSLYRHVPPSSIPKRIPNDPRVKRNLKLYAKNQRWCPDCRAAVNLEAFSPGSFRCRPCAAKRTTEYYHRVVKPTRLANSAVA